MAQVGEFFFPSKYIFTQVLIDLMLKRKVWLGVWKK
jgi:hypothetical protein